MSLISKSEAFLKLCIVRNSPEGIEGVHLIYFSGASYKLLHAELTVCSVESWFGRQLSLKASDFFSFIYRESISRDAAIPYKLSVKCEYAHSRACVEEGRCFE